MKQSDIKIYRYRWVILIIFSILNLIMQLHWLNFAAIAREARIYYDATALQIDFFALIFMIVFLIACIPASYVVDTYGIRIGTGITAVLILIFALLKGFFPSNYTIVCVAQVGLALAQPFLINSTTKVANHWFPITERATAVGIASMSQFLGMVVAMIATPFLLVKGEGSGYQLDNMLLIYGVISAVSAILLLLFMRERPATPPCIGEAEERFTIFKGIKNVFQTRDMVIVLVVVFFALGIFNAITTCIDQISQFKGLNVEQTGMLGGVMLIAGLLGAVIIPILSDKLLKRRIFLLIGMIGMCPGLIGFTFASGYVPSLVYSAIMGFFMLGCAPVLYQYAAEICIPSPESTVQGLILLVGQVSGILFVYGMNELSVIGFMQFFLVLSVINIIMFSIIKESPELAVQS